MGLNEEITEKEVIVPEHEPYKIILSKITTAEELDELIDELIDGNTLILNLDYLEKNFPEDVEKVGEKIKEIKKELDIETILLCKNEKVLMITPPEIKIVKKSSPGV